MSQCRGALNLAFILIASWGDSTGFKSECDCMRERERERERERDSDIIYRNVVFTVELYLCYSIDSAEHITTVT